ncbi:unnamed protein product [Cylicocyclus nassatus]|uniref:Uncharacterized protein n=1 Tax=Cylicocyclus nassatus TaxID=53992 RepID=A0AA36DLE2_CYLNA|nr:unnamed protein product [Cylicocyclus nassatus]
MKNAIPVVDCPGSVCIKAVITEPPAKREVCVQGAAIVRDCWSRVVAATGELALDPKPRKDMVKLSEDEKADRVLGIIYTCHGFLCNSSIQLHLVPVIVLTLLNYILHLL